MLQTKLDRMTKLIHLAFCINDRYAPYVAVTLKSLVRNNKHWDMVVHVLTGGISRKNMEVMQKAALSVKLEIHIVDDTKLRRLKDNWSIYAWYRILLPDILPEVDRILYLDADVIIDGPIAPLFELDMTGVAVAGAIDIQAFNEGLYKRLNYNPSDKYVCTGVLLMNLDYWRKNDLTSKVIEWAKMNDSIIIFPDQDAINAVCHDTKIILPMKYGVLDVYFHYDCFRTDEYRPQLLEALDHPVIIHYAGQAPWIYERMYHQFQSRWDYYNGLLDVPVSKKHYKAGKMTFREKVRHLLDYLHIWRLEKWYMSETVTDEELRRRILNM